MNDTIKQVAQQAAQQRDRILLDQLGDLVSKGLLVCEQGELSIVEVPTYQDHKYEVRQQVRFVLKDQEYIKSLEEENAKLRELIK